jgi:hypothetical protein
MRQKEIEPMDLKMADILATLGQNIAEIIDGDPEGAYLYVESTAGSCEPAIFMDVGENIVYFDADDDLFSKLFGLWNAAPRRKKWAVLEYDVKDGQFNAHFTYPDGIVPEETSHDRRERALRKRYGDKTVIYPPREDWFRELTEADLPENLD